MMARAPAIAQPKDRRRILGIGHKLGLATVVAAALCFLLLVVFQLLQESALLKRMHVERDVWATQALAQQLNGGVRWRKPQAIAVLLDGFITAPRSDLQALVAYDDEGRELFRYGSQAAAALVEVESGDEASLVRLLRQDPTPIVAEATGQLTVATVVTAGSDRHVVGYLVVEWGLGRIGETLLRELLPLSLFTGLMLLILVFLQAYLNRRFVSRPLANVTLAVSEVSKGNKVIAIPETDKADEIGDMARTVKKFQQTIAMVDRLTADQQHHAARLAQALEKEREYNALQQEFVSMASHEFRTPLAIIDGTAQRVARRRDIVEAGEIGRRMDTIRQEVQRLTGLVDSTLNVGRLDAGKLELNPCRCDLAAILRAVCARQQNVSRGHKILLELDQAPPAIWADPAHLDNIFTNLVSNAVKYSPNDPRIEIGAEHDDATATVWIRDYGIGIPEEEAPKLFQKYFRASTAQGLAGTGIGLHMVKHLVELHAGHVELESKVGAGSLFRVVLPIHPPKDAAIPLDDRSQPAADADPAGSRLAV